MTLGTNPRNCAAPCPKHNTAACPAIQYEQEQHTHGFAIQMPRITKVIGCASFPHVATKKPEAQPAKKPAVPASKK